MALPPWLCPALVAAVALAAWVLSGAGDIDGGTCPGKDAKLCAPSEPEIQGIDSIAGVDIHVPEALSHVKKVGRSSKLPEGCCWTSFQVLYDTEDKPVLAAVEDFLCKPHLLRELAQRPEKEGFRWEQGEIHRNNLVTDPLEALLTGNGWPGARLQVKALKQVDALMQGCLQPVVDVAWPGFNLSNVAMWDHLLGLISPEKQPGGTWLDAQRTPHNDIRWELGSFPNGTVPPSLATVLSLTGSFPDSGTSIWRVKRTQRDASERPSLLETVDTNRAAQGTFSTKAGKRHLHPEADVRKELPDPCPQCGLSNLWLEAIAVARLVYNRLVVYDGRRLHNQFLTEESVARLSLNASTGRLTFNSFFWQSSESAQSVKAAKVEAKKTPRGRKPDAAAAPVPPPRPIDGIAGVEVQLPKTLPRATSTARPAGVADSCCWTSFETLYDRKGRPALVSVDNFLCKPEEFVAIAEKPKSAQRNLQWTDGELTSNEKVADPTESVLLGQGFPGRKLNMEPTGAAGARVDAAVSKCLQPVVSTVWPDFHLQDVPAENRWHMMSLISPEKQLGGRWLDSQRFPHNEIRWDLGLHQPGNLVPQSVITRLGLTAMFNDTGFGIWRVKRTTRKAKERLSLLETLPDNEAAQGAYSINSGGPRKIHPELDARKEIPDPHPHATLSHAWAEAMAVASMRYNRLVLIDGRRLQHEYLAPAAYPRLSLDPFKGRLTLDSFFWQSGK